MVFLWVCICLYNYGAVRDQDLSTLLRCVKDLYLCCNMSAPVCISIAFMHLLVALVVTASLCICKPLALTLSLLL